MLKVIIAIFVSTLALASASTARAGSLVNDQNQNAVDTTKFGTQTTAGQTSQSSQSNEVPNVVGSDKTIFGQGGKQHGPNQSIPGTDTSVGSGPHTNTPGTVDNQHQNSAVPGFDTKGGATNLNLPGSDNNQHSSNDAAEAVGKLGKQEKDQLNQASQGPNVNVPTSSAPGVDVSRDRSNIPQGPTPGSGPIESNIQFGTNYHPVPEGEANAASAGEKPSSGGKEGSQPGGLNYGTSTPSNQSGEKGAGNSASASGGADKTKSDKTKKNNEPDDTDANTTSTSNVIAPNSAVARKNYGGGTGNNSEASSGKMGGLSPNSAYARRNQGGGGNDAGENNHVNKGGTLASGTPLSRKNYGDGGGSDTRGNGGSSEITRHLKVAPGGGHNQAGNNLKSNVTQSGSGQQ